MTFYQVCILAFCGKFIWVFPFNVFDQFCCNAHLPKRIYRSEMDESLEKTQNVAHLGKNRFATA